jgi:hypothetical protein
LFKSPQHDFVFSGGSLMVSTLRFLRRRDINRWHVPAIKSFKKKKKPPPISDLNKSILESTSGGILLKKKPPLIGDLNKSVLESILGGILLKENRH